MDWLHSAWDWLVEGLQRFHLPNCSGYVDCLDKWQALEAGVLGFAAAITVVWMTLRSERRREKREFQALKIAIGSEIRQFALMAIEAHERCAAAIDNPRGMSLHDLEDACRFPIPIIYESNANSVGKFGNCVHELVLFVGNISVLRQTVDRIESNTHPGGDIGRDNTVTAAGALLMISEIGEFLVARIKNPKYFENADNRYRERLKVARDAWNTRFPHPRKP
jgi:hypothetical protein